MSNIITNQVAVTGTRAALTAIAIRPSGVFIIKAHSDNAADVFVGDSTVTTSTGFPVSAGEELRIAYSKRTGDELEVQPAEIYVIGTSGDTVSWITAH